MNFIYDITLNFKKNYYEFYEWKEEDYPEFVLKIPIFKVDEECFYDAKNNNLIFDLDFISLIKNQTEIYSPNSVKIKKYACLLAYDEKVIGIELDQNGNVIKKSSVSIDEESEILDMTSLIKCSLVNYKISNKNKIINNYKTRKENEMIKLAEKKLNNLMLKKKYDLIKYIFYEIYLEKSNDINKIYIKLLNVIKNCDYRIEKINELFNLGDKEIVK